MPIRPHPSRADTKSLMPRAPCGLGQVPLMPAVGGREARLCLPLKTPRALPLPQEHPWEAAGRLWTAPWVNAATPAPAPGRLSAGLSVRARRDGQSGRASFLSTLRSKASSWVRGLWAPRGSSRGGPEQTQGLAGTDPRSLRPQESVALPVPSEDHDRVSTIHTGSGRSFSALEP